jgi:hypothetical protein
MVTNLLLTAYQPENSSQLPISFISVQVHELVGFVSFELGTPKPVLYKAIFFKFIFPVFLLSFPPCFSMVYTLHTHHLEG